MRYIRIMISIRKQEIIVSPLSQGIYLMIDDEIDSFLVFVVPNFNWFVKRACVNYDSYQKIQTNS